MTTGVEQPPARAAAKRRPAVSTAERARMSDSETAQLLDLLNKSDTVELKGTVPAEAHVATIRGLPIDPIEAQIRQVFFFDTPDLALDKAGVVVRARRSQGGRGDTVVKLRPVQPDEMRAELRKLPNFNVEVDVLPGGFVCSASLKGRTTVDAVRDVANGRLKLSKLFTKDQRAFFAQHAPDGVALDGLAVLGPTFVLKLAFDADVARFGRAKVQRVVAELWLYPDGSRILELSLRCPTNQAFQVAAEARAYLGERGIDLAAVQQTKTRAALRFYAARLNSGAA